MRNTPFRGIISALASLPPIVLRGHEYTGEGLASLVAVDPHQPAIEAAETPQIQAELGALVALAKKDQELAEFEYRTWREREVFRLTNDLEAAKAAGFACAEKSEDARGKEKPGKLPSNSAAETYVRTTPKYREHYERKIEAYRVWETLYAAHSAAQARERAVRSFEGSGYNAHPERGGSPGGSGYVKRSLEVAETAATQGDRSPVPPAPTVVPPPPTASFQAAPKSPPPPPTAPHLRETYE